MRTTVVIDDDLLRRARVRAAEAGTTLSAVVEDGLARLLETPGVPASPADELPVHGHGGLRPGVDLSENHALRDLLDAST